MERVWRFKEKVPESFSSEFPEHSRLSLQLLWNRKLRDQGAIDEFFNPDYEGDLHDPLLYLDMDLAVELVAHALEKKEKIHVFADYDHDGISGAAILHHFLKTIGGDVSVYIPDRNKEGYGLSEKAIKEIAKGGAKLLITVDCGTTNVEEVNLAKSLGMRVIILDHHVVHAEKPKADAFVNAKRPDDTYPFKWLSGAGVAFKLVEALLKSPLPITKDIPKGYEKWYLDLVAIAAVGDIVPLLGENRTLVKYGLVVLAQTRRPGLRALMRIAGLKPQLQKTIDPECKIPITNLDTYSLGFIIVPRLNAASRMDHANTAFELLITEDEGEAEALARRLEDKNRERQEAVGAIVEEIEGRIGTYPSVPHIIVEGAKDWLPGVLGIVANKLLEKYVRPVFLFQHDKNLSRGSCRAFEPFNVVDAMGSARDILKDFGGHQQAGGFTVPTKHIEEFRARLLQYTEAHLFQMNMVPTLEVDAEIEADDISWDVYGELEKFAPFGEENSKPLFLARGLAVRELRFVGQDGKHLQLSLRHEASNKVFRAIYFNSGSNGTIKDLHIGDTIDVVFELRAEEWNGMRELRLRVLDLKRP